MTEGGINDWLKNEVGVNVNVKSFEKEFSNGYYFGEVFYLFGLAPNFKDIFQNKPQPIYRKRNYQALRTLFKQVGIEWKVDLERSIKKEEIGAAKKLLFKLKAALEPFEDNLKILNKNGKTLAEESIEKRMKKRTFANKTKIIERKLVSFEEAFVRQKERALELKNQDEARYREIVQSQRKIRRDNLKLNHEYMKEWEKQHYGLWKRTKEEQKEIKERMKNFKNTMTKKLIDKELRMINRDQNDVINGIKEFEENANRLGIELDHNPDTYVYKEKGPFNPIASIQKITRKAEEAEKSRKDRDKVIRIKKVKQRKAEKEIEAKSELEKKISKYLAKSKLTLEKSEETFLADQRKQKISQNLNEYFLKRKEEAKESIKETLKNLEMMVGDDWEEKKRLENFALRETILKDRETLFNKNYGICKDIMNFLLEITEEAHEYQESSKNIQIPDLLFREMIDRFKKFEENKDEDDLAFSKNEEQLKTKEEKEEELNKIFQTVVLRYYHSKNEFEPPLSYGEIKERVRYKGEEKEESLASTAREENQLEIIEEGNLESVQIESTVLQQEENVNYVEKPENINFESEKNSQKSERENLEGEEEKSEIGENPYAVKGGDEESVSRSEEGEIEEITEIVNEDPPENEKFAEMLSKVIDRVFPMKPREEPIQNFPTFLPLKISLRGPPFSGKKTLAKELAKDLDLTLVDKDKLIEKAKDFAEKQEEYEKVKQEQESADQEEDPKKAKAKKSAKKRGGKKVDLEELELTEEEQKFAEIGFEIFKAEEEEQEPSPKLIIELIKLELKRSFNRECELSNFPTLLKEAEEKVEQEALEEKAENEKTNPKGKGKNLKNKSSKSSLKKEKKNSKPLETEESVKEAKTFEPQEFPFTKGFVMVGFPETEEEAKILENEIGGFCPVEERFNEQAEKEKFRASRLVKMGSRIQPKDDLPVFDLVLDINIKFEKIVERLSRCQVDEQTGEIYDSELNPMPSNDRKLKERLKPLEYEEDTLRDLYEKHEQQREDMNNWYAQFGYELRTKTLKRDSLTQSHQIITEVEEGKESSKMTPQIDPVLSSEKITQNFDSKEKKLDPLEEASLDLADIPLAQSGIGSIFSPENIILVQPYTLVEGDILPEETVKQLAPKIKNVLKYKYNLYSNIEEFYRKKFEEVNEEKLEIPDRESISKFSNNLKPSQRLGLSGNSFLKKRWRKGKKQRCN